MDEDDPFSFKLVRGDSTRQNLGLDVDEEVRCVVNWLPLWMNNWRLEPLRVDSAGNEYLELEPEELGKPWGLEVKVLTGDGTATRPTVQRTYVFPVDVVLKYIGDSMFGLIELPPATHGDRCEWHGRHSFKPNAIVSSDVCSACKARVLRILRKFQRIGEIVT